MKTINIACASNDHYFPGMLAAVMSLLIHSKPDYKYHFYIINGGLSDKNLLILNETLHRINVQSNVTILNPDLSIFEGLPKFFFNSVLPYARLLLPEHTDVDKIIYIDSDIIFFKDISVLWETDLQGNYAAAAPDMSVLKLKYEFSDCSVFNLDPEAQFFNSGIMVLDLKAFREFGLHKKTIELRINHPNYFKYHDQSPLNVVLYKKTLFLSQDWNYQSHCFIPNTDFEKIFNFQVNFHFVTSFKPWLYFNHNPTNLLFYKLLSLLNYEINNSHFKNSKRKYYLRSRFLSVLPFYYFIRGSLKALIGDKNGSLMDKKLRRFWAETIEINRFYKSKSGEIAILLNNWENKINSRLL